MGSAILQAMGLALRRRDLDLYVTEVTTRGFVVILVDACGVRAHGGEFLTVRLTILYGGAAAVAFSAWWRDWS